ncbi:hypothetical protein BD410DRAFT_786387 [Rickenella mellea]|uniref:Phosphatidylinositol 4-kinase n=1 Tax=Rickenella mellea TaxID=50990 RepID=A0A4Y7QB21_9AGAM|nr:hypothetical protein BD410DRAFT_786387 [Rickenella mellea]
MPNRADYQPLAQSADEGAIAGSSNQAPPRRLRRLSRPGPIDLSKLDTAFKKWTEGIAQKMKGKKKVEDHSRKEILTSVFDPPVPPAPGPQGPVKTLDHNPPLSKSDFEGTVLSVRRAISEGIHPKMITKGSSGSYFARAKVDGRVQTVAVFKPKDEEPYGRLNPKTTKWVHRQFRWLIPFGRSCLIPNLSYISEAAASLLDDRLNLNIVPRTELVSFSSPAFFYDWLDRNAAKKGKPLPEKIGSMQVFMHGYQDASDFLRKHPWPGRSIADTFDDSTHRTGTVTKRLTGALKVLCGSTGDDEDVYDEDDHEEERALFDATEDDGSTRPFYWSSLLQQSFREELEKLIILDYLMRNTDRGADNYMIKYCDAEHDKSLVDVAPSKSEGLQMPTMGQPRSQQPMTTSTESGTTTPRASEPPKVDGTPPPATSSLYTRQPHIHIAAIDNSLAFPHEHPRGWRSFTFGWLYLPVSVIGRPFSSHTRNHFLPLLTSKAWWEETTFQLRKIHALDPDFNWKMFQRQLAVVKGQAWNIVQSLRHSDEGPLELTRRQKVLVWDDEVEVEDDTIREIFNAPLTASPKASINTMPLPSPSHRRSRSQSAAEFPPPMRRSSTDITGVTRPVPFSTKFPRVHPGTTGVTVLEHMERVDAVEAGLRRLGRHEDSVIEEEDEAEEVDMGVAESVNTPSKQRTQSPLASPVDELPAVPEMDSLASSVVEEDLVAMSKSTPTMYTTTGSGSHFRWTTDQNQDTSQNLEWMRPEATEENKKRIMIVERLETVDTKPFFSCW